MNRRTLVLVIGVVLLVAFAAAAFLYQRAIPPEQPAAPSPQDTNALVRFHSPVFGSANAPVTVVEFFDPSCEACRAFYPYVKQILAENPNDVRLVLRYVLFHGSPYSARPGAPQSWCAASRTMTRYTCATSPCQPECCRDRSHPDQGEVRRCCGSVPWESDRQGVETGNGSLRMGFQ